MKTSFIPKKAKSLLKAEIQRIASKAEPLSVRAIKYIPYKHEASSFLIPKVPETGYETCSSGLPIPPSDLWHGYGETTEEHLTGGHANVSKMLELVNSSGFSFEKGTRILDFGCGAGRMIRHLKNLSDICEIWGTDINANHIGWAKQNLSPHFHFATTTTIPHLPFEDRYFNFIYCGSVFTHIDDLAEAWLLELRRILSPKGKLYLTIHDDHTMKLLDGPLKDNWFAKNMKEHDIYNNSKSILGMLVIGRGIKSQIFYNIDYFCKMLKLLLLNVLSVTQEAYGKQTAILVERQ